LRPTCAERFGAERCTNACDLRSSAPPSTFENTRRTRELGLDECQAQRRIQPRASLNSIVSGADERTTIGWRDVVAVVKASAVRRIGQPLLIADFVLALAGIAVVALSVVVMYF